MLPNDCQVVKTTKPNHISTDVRFIFGNVSVDSLRSDSQLCLVSLLLLFSPSPGKREISLRHLGACQPTQTWTILVSIFSSLNMSVHRAALAGNVDVSFETTRHQRSKAFTGICTWQTATVWSGAWLEMAKLLCLEHTRTLMSARLNTSYTIMDKHTVPHARQNTQKRTGSVKATVHQSLGQKRFSYRLMFTL